MKDLSNKNFRISKKEFEKKTSEDHPHGSMGLIWENTHSTKAIYRFKEMPIKFQNNSSHKLKKIATLNFIWNYIKKNRNV